MAADEEDVLAPWLPGRPGVNFTQGNIEFENEGGRQKHVIECGHVVRTHDGQNCMVLALSFVSILTSRSLAWYLQYHIFSKESKKLHSVFFLTISY